MSIDNAASAAGAGSPAWQSLLVRSAPPTLFQRLWNLVKALFSARPGQPMLTPAEVEQRMRALKTTLFAAMNTARKGLSGPQKRAFAERSAALIQDVLVHSLWPVRQDQARRADAGVREAVFQKAALHARVKVQRHLELVRFQQEQRLDAPEVRKVLVANPAGSHLDKVERVLVLRAAPPIEHLVLAGGGAKGMGNGPALRVLQNLGLLPFLKKVVGTSAGALTAVCLAAGMSPHEFQTLSNTNRMSALVRTPSDFAQRYPQVRLEGGLLGAGRVLELLDRSSAASVKHYLGAHWDDITAAPQWNSLSAADHERLLRLRDQDLDAIPRTGDMVTFRDLSVLHLLAPAKFKELVLTGYNTTRKQTVYFSAATHPDLPVALAGRASMAIPLVFKAVVLEADGRREKFVDGGVGSNMPSEAILDGLHGRALDEAQSRTLLMTFYGPQDQGAFSDTTLYGSPRQRARLVGWLSRLFTNEQLDVEKIHFAGVHVLPVRHAQLDTLSFHASQDEVEQAQTEAILYTLEHMENVMGGLRHDVVRNEAEAARLLSQEEQNQFLARYAQDTDPLVARMCQEILALQALQGPPDTVQTAA